MWMNPKYTMLSQRSQTQKATESLISLNIIEEAKPKERNQIDAAEDCELKRNIYCKNTWGNLGEVG